MNRDGVDENGVWSQKELANKRKNNWRTGKVKTIKLELQIV